MKPEVRLFGWLGAMLILAIMSLSLQGCGEGPLKSPTVLSTPTEARPIPAPIIAAPTVPTAASTASSPTSISLPSPSPLLTITQSPVSLPSAAPRQSGSDFAPPNPSAPATARPRVPERAGGSLVIAARSDPGGFNPTVFDSAAVRFVSGSLYNGLVSITPGARPEPELAQGWQVEDGGKTYRFFLRREVRWHDGKPFTSADVEFTFEEMILKYNAKAALGLLIDTVDAPNETTVVIHLKAANSGFLALLGVSDAPIFPKHLNSGTAPKSSPTTYTPVGTGPYRLVEYRPGQSVGFERNPDYFREGFPRFERLMFRIIPDLQEALVAFEKGEVDYLTISESEVGQVEKMAGIKVERVAAASPDGASATIVAYRASLHDLRPWSSSPAERAWRD